ncbi:MAG: di-heme oxidoredictase family protein [Halarcobacter sp.]
MLQTLKKLKYKLTFLLVALFATSNITLADSKNLSDEEYDKYILGRSFFTIPWVEAPSATTARDGLGPLFNANTCNSCHPKTTRGILYNKNGTLSRTIIAKLSIPSNNSKEHKDLIYKNGLVTEPTYGGQIAINAVHGVKFEGRPEIHYEEININFPDGEVETLLKPKYSIENLQYGDLHKDTILTFRLAPSLYGVGFLNDIKEEDILANTDEFDKDNDGISGKANFVYSPFTKKYELGRFSWKANLVNLKHQTANAAINDMGLTTTIYQKDTCTKEQIACNNSPKGRDAIDLPDNRLEAVVYFLEKQKLHKVNKTKEFKEGLKLFKQIGCVKCHVDTFITKSGKKIAPFTDMLLHDMGEGLSDGRSEFKATESEWRTPALWGLSLNEKVTGKKPRLLHDGRARSVQEAILWHDGEAKNIKENYMKLEKKDRDFILKFLEEV